MEKGLTTRILRGMVDSIGTATKTGRGNDKRDRLIAAARKTVHEQGAEHTTLAMVAAAADVPVGNVYYYFKTKDELLSAVIGAYDNSFVMLDAILARHRTPKTRLKALVRTWTAARERLARYGCPIGSLCSELAKHDNHITGEASAVLAHLISLAQDQFEQLGRRDARELAVALIASYEGIALIANTLRDPALIATEARRLERWIDSI